MQKQTKTAIMNHTFTLKIIIQVKLRNTGFDVLNAATTDTTFTTYMLLLGNGQIFCKYKTV